MLPRTTGGLLVSKPAALSSQPVTPLVNSENELTPAMLAVVEDIFRKFDIFISRELSYEEFRVLYRITGAPRELTPEEFDEQFLKKYCSTSEGITIRGI